MIGLGFHFINVAYMVNEDSRNSGSLEEDATNDRFPSSKDAIAVVVSISWPPSSVTSSRIG